MKIIADLYAHGKTDVVTIRNIPMKRDFNSRKSDSDEQQQARKSDGSCGCRFISIGRDNSAFIWYFKVIDGVLSYQDELGNPLPPIAKLAGGLSSITSSGGGALVHAHFDESTATLFTSTASDRSIRMWDLTALNKQQVTYKN
jgi:hypothetical protein